MNKTPAPIRLIGSLLNPAQPGFLILYVTNRCNFRCPFCFYHAEIEKGGKPDELTLEELEKTSKKTGPLVQLSITGGEPFLRPDLARVAALFIENASPRYVTVPTNASLTRAMVEFVESTVPRYPKTYFRLAFSIDAIGGEQDRVRAFPGSFARIEESCEAMAPLRKKFPNLTLDANATFTAETESAMVETLKTLKADFAFDNLSVTYARGEIKDPELKRVSHEKYVAVNRWLERVERTKERRALYPLWRAVRDVSRENLIRTVVRDEFVAPCVAGRKLVVLSETGEVRACEILPGSVGNIRDFDYDLRRVLSSPRARELTRWIVDSKCKCSFECALGANVAWNPSSYGRLMKAAVRNVGRRFPSDEAPEAADGAAPSRPGPR